MGPSTWHVRREHRRPILAEYKFGTRRNVLVYHGDCCLRARMATPAPSDDTDFECSPLSQHLDGAREKSSSTATCTCDGPITTPAGQFN